MHQDYEGRVPLFYYATRLREGGQHASYACFNMRDILWPLLVRFYMEGMSNL